jgi:hypothetical protein
MAIASPIFAFSFTADFTSSNWVTSGDVKRNNTLTVSLSNAASDGGDDVTNLNFSGTNPTAAGGPLETFLGVATGFLDIDNVTKQAQEGFSNQANLYSGGGGYS